MFGADFLLHYLCGAKGNRKQVKFLCRPAAVILL